MKVLSCCPNKLSWSYLKKTHSPNCTRGLFESFLGEETLKPGYFQDLHNYMCTDFTCIAMFGEFVKLVSLSVVRVAKHGNIHR